MAKRTTQGRMRPYSIPRIVRVVASLVVTIVMYVFKLLKERRQKNETAARQSGARKTPPAEREIGRAEDRTPTQRKPVKLRSSRPGGGVVRDQVAGNAALVRAIENRQSDVIVESEGVVQRLLADDIEGDRHQRFILQLSGGQTILIAHNIDVAQRVPVAEPDRVSFKGEFEWNEQGGCVHWTHRDPAGRHADGWVMVDGEKFE